MTELQHLTLVDDAYVETVTPELDGYAPSLDEVFDDSEPAPQGPHLRVLRHEPPRD